MISMLRGVNVGSHKRMKMAPLQAVYESLGLENPQAYLQSGNVVFKTRERDLTSLASRIESGIEQHFGFRPDVILRTSSELRSVVARNPFAARAGIEPGKLLVTFLAGECGKEAQENLLSVKTDSEEMRIDGRELYIYFPLGMGRSKLTPALIEKKLKAVGTSRNWNTVRNLFAMTEKLEEKRADK
jgi:uncharacterized protein (DUF1697 family)